MTEKSKNEIIKAFEDKIVHELKKEFSEDRWTILSEGSDRIKVTIQNKSWGDTTKVAIFDYPDVDRLCFATWYNGIGLYKDVYLMIRRDFAGRYNRFNWWLNLKEPYNKWDENNTGIAAVQNGNEEFIKYITEQLKKIVNRFNEVYTAYEQICQIQKGILTTEFHPKQWIYESSVLVHDYVLSDKSLAVVTRLIDEGWEIQLFGRNQGSIDYLNKLFSEHPDFRKEFEPIDNNSWWKYRQPLYKNDIYLIPETLNKILIDFEKVLKLATNQPSV